MKAFEVGQFILYPQDTTLQFRVMAVLNRPDGEAEVTAYYWPEGATEADVREYNQKMTDNSDLKKLMAMQMQRVPFPDTWYRVNYLIPLYIDRKMKHSGEWFAPHARYDAAPFKLLDTFN